MTHEEMRERLLDLACGELSPREAQPVEAHAASCEACRAELEAMRETRRLMSALPQEEAPAGGERTLLAAAREEVARRASARRPRRWLWGGALAAASLAVVASVSYRILAARPGPLERERIDALLGASPHAAAPAPEPDAPAVAPPDAKAPESSRRPGGATGARRGGDAAAMAGPPSRREPAPSGAAAPASEGAPRDARGAASAAPDGPPRAAGGGEGAAGFAERPAPGFTDELEAPGRAERGAATAEAAERGERSAAAVREPSPQDPASAERPPPVGGPAAPSEGKATARGAVPEAAPEPLRGGDARSVALLRREELRRSGRLRSEVRTFAGCEGEARREVEIDPGGRVVVYVREGRIGGRRLRIEHVYGADGLLAAATVRDLDGAGAPDPDALGLALPRRAEEAAIDAPPRCGQ